MSTAKDKRSMRERMLAGDLYNPFGDPELGRMSVRAQRLVRAFNRTKSPNSFPTVNPKIKIFLLALKKLLI